MSTAITKPRIAVIGGLTLLLTLCRRGIPATLYEREADFSTRRHLGGTLDLGYDSGQRALPENGLQKGWEANSRPEGDSNRFCDSQKLLFSFGGGDSQDPLDLRPEIDRSALRQIMLDALPADAIKWGHGLTSIRALSDGEHELTFANGHTTVSDHVVGADGAHSKVRPLLSPAQPIYHGVTGAEISLAPETVKSPELAETVANVGMSSMWAVDFQRILGAQVNSSGRIRTYAWFRSAEDWRLPEDPAEGRKALLAMHDSFQPWMRNLIAHCDPKAMYERPLYHLPLDHSWEHIDGVTLLGDAAHLMSPFAGAGANLAMLDGLELGLVLEEAIAKEKSREERKAAIKVWEDERMSEGRRVMAIAAHNVEVAFSVVGPQGMMEAMEESMNPASRRKARLFRVYDE